MPALIGVMSLSPANEGTLFISRQVFWATGSDPARFGGGHLSEFAPIAAPPYRLANSLLDAVLPNSLREAFAQ